MYIYIIYICIIFRADYLHTKRMKILKSVIFFLNEIRDFSIEFSEPDGQAIIGFLFLCTEYKESF